MKRSTWVAVLVTAAVLVVAGNLPRLPLDGVARSWRAGIERQVATWPRLARRTPPAIPAPRAAGHPTRHPLVAVAPARLLATPVPPRPAVRGFAWPGLPALPVRVAVPTLAGALAGLVAFAVLGLALRRDRRRHVWQLARRGLTAARIARTAGVPQDAVRTLLTPGVGARR